MTPLGLNPAAVPETAALFPLSAAPPPAAEGSPSSGGVASTAFGDLLAANFAQAGQPQNVVAADLASSGFTTLSLADVWFAGLNLDLDALNAGLEVEEAGVPAEAAPAAAIPVSEAAVDDEAAALMAFAVSIPVPAPLAIPAPGDESAETGSESRLPDLLVGPASSGLPGEPDALAPQAETLRAIAPDRTSDTAVPSGVSLSGAAAPVSVAPAIGIASAPAIEAPKTATAVTGVAIDTATLVAPNTGGAVAQAPQLPDVQQPEVSAAPGPLQESSVEELPKEQLLKPLESAPAMQQTGRTRDSVVSKLAEMSGLGVSGDAAAKPAPGTNFEADSQSQSETQDGSTEDGFLLGFKESATPARSADGAPITPVFSVTAPVAGPARAVVVEGATLPPAPPAATVPGPENVGRLIESMRVQMRQGVQEATVRLNPEHLGEVTISVRVERGAVSAVVNAETPAVQQWLESQEDKLRSGLSEQGLHLAKFIVQRDGSQQHREQPQPQKQPARDRQQRDGAPIRFEVLV